MVTVERFIVAALILLLALGGIYGWAYFNGRNSVDCTKQYERGQRAGLEAGKIEGRAKGFDEGYKKGYRAKCGSDPDNVPDPDDRSWPWPFRAEPETMEEVLEPIPMEEFVPTPADPEKHIWGRDKTDPHSPGCS